MDSKEVPSPGEGGSKSGRNCCRPSGAWKCFLLSTRGRRFALTPGYLLAPLRGWGFPHLETPDDRRRTKLAHALKGFGVRVQYSVFECLLEADQVEKLHLRIGRLISPEEDSVRLYRICADCGLRTQVLGLGKLSEDPDVYLM